MTKEHIHTNTSKSEAHSNLRVDFNWQNLTLVVKVMIVIACSLVNIKMQ